METIKPSKNSPIGIFDSGLGGLTVLKSLETILPNESFIYFGDTAHVPYGTKSAETVIRYSQHIMDFFQKHDTKAVVIACNTASALAFQHLQRLYNIPLFDVVTPSVEFAIDPRKTKDSFDKFFWGDETIVIPIYNNLELALKKHSSVEIVVNFSSFRTAYHSTMELMNYKQIKWIHNMSPLASAFKYTDPNILFLVK